MYRRRHSGSSSARRPRRASGTAPARTRTRNPSPGLCLRPASARAMRMVSSDFSLTLCAFSVLSARILNATSGSGTSKRDDALRAELLHGLQAVVAVRRPIAVVLANQHERIEEAPDLLDHGHQFLDVRLGRIALVGRRFDLVDRQRHDQHRRAAERVAIGAQDRAAVVLDRAPSARAASRCRRSASRRPSVQSTRQPPFCAGGPLLCLRHPERISAAVTP